MQRFDPPQHPPGRTRLETRIGKNGRRLRNRRNDADDEANADVSEQLTESMLLARSLLADLADLGGPSRAPR